jgi:hypothetical protein
MGRTTVQSAASPNPQGADPIIPLRPVYDLEWQLERWLSIQPKLPSSSRPYSRLNEKGPGGREGARRLASQIRQSSAGGHRDRVFQRWCSEKRRQVLQPLVVSIRMSLYSRTNQVPPCFLAARSKRFLQSVISSSKALNILLTSSSVKS